MERQHEGADDLVRCELGCGDWVPQDQVVMLRVDGRVQNCCTKCYPEVAKELGAPEVVRACR